MIIDVLHNSKRYERMHQGFAEAFAFLRRQDLRDLATGRYEIDGERLFAIVARDSGRKKDEAQLETHEKYIDIQLVVEGLDEMGWRPKSKCLAPAGSHSAEEDIRFYNDPPLAWQPVAAGMFAVFFPEDAHLPLIGEGMIHKVVVKVAVGGETKGRQLSPPRS